MGVVLKAAGRTNDVLTIIKLSPLVLIIIGGLAFLILNPSAVGANLSPFVTGDAGAFGTALILIFWAYAGFELSTIPANEVEKPERTIPKAIVLGMLFVIAFYLLTNLVVVGSVSSPELTSTNTPLITTASTIFSGPVLSTIMMLVVGVGALFSILGADESGTIGTSRLAYAMSLDGLLPRSFANKHQEFGTPYVALIVLCSTAFIASVFGGLAALISSSVFLLAFVYLATCLSAIGLERRNVEAAKKLRWKTVIPMLGAGFSLVLIVLVNPVEIAVSMAVLGVGVLVYAYFSPKKELAEAKALFLSDEAVLGRVNRQSITFLAHPVFHLKHRVNQRRQIGPAIAIIPKDDPTKRRRE
jgi:amino acid transporter